MGARARTLCNLSEILPKIVVIFEVRVIEEMDCSSLLFAKSLSLSQALGWLWAMLIPEFDKGLAYHLSHGKISGLLIHQVRLSYSPK